MYRAQAIKLRWQKEKQNDTNSSRIAPLSYLLDYEYKQYLNLCFWCHEKPLKKGRWLLQQIELSET